MTRSPAQRQTPDPADWLPLEPGEHEAQCAALLALLGDKPKRVVDIGAGGGRVAAPLLDAGHAVLAVDADTRAIERCAALGAETVAADALDPATRFVPGAGPADAAVCLGHTFLLFHNPEPAAAMLARLREDLSPGAWLALDNFCEPLWEQVAAGYWQEGLSEDGSMQLVWAPGENVFALRCGDGVDPKDQTIRASDRLHRLWSLGELRLLARLAGWDGPFPDAAGALLLFRPEG